MSSWNGVKIKGVRVVNKMPEFINKVERNAARAITQALIIGGAEASVLTPIKTGNLINSQYRSVTKEGDKIVGTAGYTADYALPVHDPDHPQVFRRPSAQKNFLKEGFERGKANIDAVVKGTLKT